ncbi:hypothetical protein BDE18_2268 [Paracoccus pantotrophus]|uniref:Uncharacterized protein n=1 Tax=Paracoccus pantotrophus TaxID=82367 RepID=A0AAE6NTS4_PARPN|nr:hypothetical protein [Paracoccus pantotrophus]QFG34927.1 hypothetical protein ESD82_01600 [Paracoccus pantotrophus]RKS43479.1 hypothetical protein BDE18_2268 [Paracoccus pantotrophus]
MGDDPDFLLLYDLAPLAKRAALLETFFVHPDERRGFQHIVDDPLLRARLEFEFNQTVPFESFHLLVDTGFARPADEFRRRSKLACGRVLPNVVATDRMRDKPPVVPGLWDVHRFLASCARCHRRSAEKSQRAADTYTQSSMWRHVASWRCWHLARPEPPTPADP